MLIAAGLLVLASLVGAVPLHKVPLADGTFDFLDDWQLQKIREDSKLDYNPETDIVFLLYTRSNATEGQQIRFRHHEDLRSSHFDPRKPTRFLVHGWNGDRRDPTIRRSREEFLKRGDCNVFGIDWCAGGCHKNYATARYRVQITGFAIADFIRFLVEEGADLADIHAIGHSLGGHVVGNIGKQTQSLLDGRKLTRIVALDPAGPLFEYLSGDKDIIGPEDAEYVEVIHTNGGTAGYLQPAGSVDFYPAGGKSQTGCGSDLLGSCAHGRAVEYFVESINSKVPFVGQKCVDFKNVSSSGCEFEPGTKNFGDEKNSGTGIYYFQVNEQSPYAQGHQ